MKLNVSERLTLVGIVPQKGNFETMTTVQNLKDLLYLSEEEVKEFEVKQSPDNVSWNEKATEKREIKISEMGMHLLTKVLKGLDEKEELTSAQYLIYKRIKEEGEEKEKTKK